MSGGGGAATAQITSTNGQSCYRCMRTLDRNTSGAIPVARRRCRAIWPPSEKPVAAAIMATGIPASEAKSPSETRSLSRASISSWIRRNRAGERPPRAVGAGPAGIVAEVLGEPVAELGFRHLAVGIVLVARRAPDRVVDHGRRAGLVPGVAALGLAGADALVHQLADGVPALLQAEPLGRGAAGLAAERVAGEGEGRMIVDRDRGHHAQRITRNLHEAFADLAGPDAPLDAIAAGAIIPLTHRFSNGPGIGGGGTGGCGHA